MSEQLAIDILKIVVPIVTALFAYHQWQYKALYNDMRENRRFIEMLLQKCMDEKDQTSPQMPWEKLP